MLTRILKFGAVGVINTLLDFVIFNILTSKRINLPKIRANLISTTTAMIFSFVMNKRFVFEATGGNFWLQAATFFAVTAFGLYALQNLVIYILLMKWQLIPRLFYAVIELLKLNKILAFLSKDFVYKNVAKAFGTAFSMTWNYLMFEFVVFHL